MASPRLLGRDFFARSVHTVGPDLIGASLFADGVGGVIVEVEAYHHTDPAAHSYRGRTERNAVMFGPPGYAYVYRSYGIHWCVNFVCEEEGSASAVLIRALQPTAGLEVMAMRRGLSPPPSWPRSSRPSTSSRARDSKDVDARHKHALGPAEGRTRVAGHDESAVDTPTLRALCSGPGKLCQALGITVAHNGLPLDRLPFELRAREHAVPVEIAVGPRIGITKAIEQPWRYGLKGSRFLSRPFSHTPR